MSRGTSVQFEIPSIDGKATFHPARLAQQERERLYKVINAPSDISGRSLLGKIALGLLVGAMMSLVLVLLMYVFGIAIGGGQSAFAGAGFGAQQQTHPLAWLILLFGWFVVTFFWSMILLFMYSMFFSHKYLHTRKTVWLLLLINTILFIMMMVFFVVFQGKGVEVLLFGLYVVLALFISFAQMEIVVNPNYSASALAGSTIWMVLSLIVFWVIWNALVSPIDISRPYMLVWMSTLIVFPLMIFGQWIWEIIYYKIYENGSNPFYIPSQAELDTDTLLENQKKEQEKETISVDF